MVQLLFILECKMDIDDILLIFITNIILVSVFEIKVIDLRLTCDKTCRTLNLNHTRISQEHF